MKYWAQICKPFTVRHPHMEKTVTADSLRECVDRFHGPVMVSHKFRSLDEPAYSEENLHGWVMQIEMRGDDLWGLLELNRNGELALDKLPWCVPAITFTKDGCRLVCCALSSELCDPTLLRVRDGELLTRVCVENGVLVP